MPYERFGQNHPILDAARVKSLQGLGSVGDGTGLTNLVAGADIDINGNVISRSGNKILLYDSAGAILREYAATQAGLVAALTAWTAGDTVLIPSLTIACTSGITTGATIKGVNELTSTISFSGFGGAALTLTDGGLLSDLSIAFNGTSQSDITTLSATGCGMATKIIHCNISAFSATTNRAAIIGGNALYDGPEVNQCYVITGNGVNNYSIDLRDYASVSYSYIGAGGGSAKNIGVIGNATNTGINGAYVMSCWVTTRVTGSYGCEVLAGKTLRAVHCYFNGITGGVLVDAGATFEHGDCIWNTLTNSGGTLTDLASGSLGSLTDDKIWIGNASNVPTEQSISNDATLANTGALTLATVNSNVGSFTNANITVNAKGLITAAANGGAGLGIVHDDVSASCNGVTVQFSTSATFSAGSTAVTLNGLLLRPGVGNSYVEDVGLGSITLAIAPIAGDELLIAYVASGTGAATATISDVYIATTGSDTTGNGSSGSPYATLAKAVSVLPDYLNGNCTIHCAAGTYAEAINLYRFTCREDATLAIVGAATFSGTVSYGGASYNALVRGPIQAQLSTLTFTATADNGIGILDHANVTLTACVVSGTTTGSGMIATESRCKIDGNLTITNFSGNGISCTGHTIMTVISDGTLTLTGTGPAQIGIWVGYQSQFVCYGLNWVVAISVVIHGIQLNLHAIFQYWVGTGSISITNASTPGGSMAIQCTDLSTWSTQRPLTLDHFTYGFDVSSLSYAEASGSRTVTNVGSLSNTYLGGVTYLP